MISSFSVNHITPMETTTEQHETNTTTASRSNGNGHAPANAATRQLAYTLKTAIDQEGRYKQRLDDMAMGYGAGQGITAHAARNELESAFSQEVGMRPHAYLDQHYEQLKEERASRDHGQER